MAENSKIEWTTHTFNPWRGCTKVSPGCKNCYAESLAGRNPGVLGEWGKEGTRVVAAEAQWREPVRWNREAGAARARVFCASLADVFEGPETLPVDFSQPAATGEQGIQCVPPLMNYPLAFARSRLFQLIDDTPNLDWLLLTKRPENVVPLYGAWLHWTRVARHTRYGHWLWPRNVWLGASVENQDWANIRLPILSRIPAYLRFVSYEPALGPVDLREWLAPPGSDRGVNWVIVGGESGGGARPFDPQWARVVVDQCQDAGVPVFVKQMGANPVGLSVRGKGGDPDQMPPELRVRQFPGG